MLACLCCKKGDVGFKEFENTEGEEYRAELASPSSQNGPEVYILPLTEVSLPVSKQPARSIQLLKSSDLGRHSLLYLKEIGHGWFGKVLLGEVNAGLSITQVVVKELKASASVQDQMQFLEEVQPYRTLQHPALLQCLAQCSEVTPYLLVMEFCPLGDLKTYLRSCRIADSESPDPLILQRMACDVASGLLHLHKHNFTHSDLALRNCLLTSEMSVKIGDYGLSHSRYKEDYYVTQDQIWVALRWIAPELIDEVHGNLLVVDQTKSSNIWSLGVTMWELFELGNQPYRHYSDRQVLTYVVKEQQLKLPKPHLQFQLAERWYEVMQFCWLQPELRPSSEEVHLLVTYLCAKGSSEAEEDFEQRWDALRPNLQGSTSHTATSTALVLTPTTAPADNSGTDPSQAVELASSASSSFPLLEHFSDSFHSDTGDDLLTVTETSHGLNFEYKWEQARAEQPYCSSSTSGPLGQGNPHYQDIYYSSKGSTSGGCKTDSLTSGISLSYYEPEHPGVVPVLSAHSPSVSSEYYIRIEEPVECNINLDDSVVDYSPGLEASNSRLSSESRTASSMAQPRAYWSTADNTKYAAYDSDSSPTVQLTIDPLLRQASRTSPMNCFSPNQDGTIYCEQTSAYKTCHQSCLSEHDSSPESRSNLVYSVGCLENTCSLSQAVSSPSLGFCDPYLEASTGRSTVSDSCHNMMGPLRKTLPIVNHISIDVGTDDGLLVGHLRGEDIEDDLFSEGDATNWTSNRSANNNSLTFESRQTAGSGPDTYLDLHYRIDHSNTTELRSLTKATTETFNGSISPGNVEGERGDSGYDAGSELMELSSYIHLSHKEREEAATQVEMNSTAENLIKFESHTSSSINSRSTDGGKVEGKYGKQSLLHGERLYSEPKMIPETSFIKSPSSFKDPQIGQTGALSGKHRGNIWDGVSSGISVCLGDKRLSCPERSESSRALERNVGARESGMSLIEIGDYSEDDDDDMTDITSGIFADFNLDYAEVEEEELSPLKNPGGTSDSIDTFNLSSSMASACDQAFSPDPFNTPILPKSLDSGYDTENNESPEFIFKELGDTRGGEGSPRLGGEPEIILQVGLGQGVCTSTNTSELHLKSLIDKNPYRDSAYFSDYDVENEKSPQEEGSTFFVGSPHHVFTAEKLDSFRGDNSMSRPLNNGEHLTNLKNKNGSVVVNLSEGDHSSTTSLPTPGLSMLSPFPPQMGGCLTKESAPAEDDLGLETEHSGEEPPSELSSSITSEPSSAVQEASANREEGSRRAEDCSSFQSLNSDSTLTDCIDEVHEENDNGVLSTEEEELPEFNHMEEDRRDSVGIREDDFEDIDAEECDSQDSLCEESNGPVDLSSSSSLLELCGEDVRAPLEEAEDEDDSDDSESDEELRTYNIQDEDSEESEEDFTTVPVVVSDCSRARHLRSLLKMPTLLTQSFCDELERKKKVVSFFDDVTVFLFDQESPTGELADFTFATGTESSEQESSEANTSDHRPQPDADLEGEVCESLRVSEQTDGIKSEEDGSYEWKEELSFEPRPSSPDVIPEPQSSPTSTSNSPEDPKPAAVALNRFMVSRFSITHVSDSHISSATGEDE
ncbi:serine serine/threonine-protein kinase LMTK1-like isoform X1 [Solea senegalensis]|nr:serine serine/threonine-protein kinase LMTK1-like isoform X1 [Solea senegalensis]